MVFSSRYSHNGKLLYTMASHNDTGKLGEQLATEWLKNNSFTILHTNWRHKNWEVDMIATRENVLHFIEVKTRRTLLYGYPEDSVSRNKIYYLTGAAEEYLYIYPQWNRIQFDILSITIMKQKTEYFFI